MTVWTVRLAHTPLSLLAAVVWVSGILSALFVNDVVCLVLAPLIIELTRQLEIPHLVALATAPNVGSVATLTGNPQKINWQLPVLFTGLFVVIGGAETAGLTDRLFAWAQAMNLERPVVLTSITAVVYLVSNVPAVLLIKPLIPSFAEPGSAWLVAALASTLAGNLTIVVGSVANLIVVEAARGARIEVRFLEYCRVGVPLTLVTLLVGWLVLRLLPPP